MIKTTNEVHNDFLVYAKEINEDRAFPNVIDGLKPSQRASLWEMFVRNYSSNKPHIKSAKVDGGVIANWHPHGTVYDTFGRMSQGWINNICEVDWHGANGSQLHSPELAASRYTECRLAKASEDGFFSNINKNVVDFIPNYSEDTTWPKVLPAIFPRLFVNGSQGIGYTIAQEWEPGNLIEFTNKVKEYIKTKKVNCNDIYPDYPSGGIIINKDDIHTIYETGKGSVILRAKTEIENNIIKITELPYQVYAEPLIQSIKDLVNDNKLDGIEDIYNKSDDNGLLIEIECSGDPNYILNRLFKLTDLQCIFNANQMALLDDMPEMFTLEKYIKTFIDSNKSFIEREYKYDLDKATLRKEIVEGLVIAIRDIDSVISTIKSSKSSDDARKNLVNSGFTDNQAKAIVDMKLGKLAQLEGVELDKELKDLNKKIADCNKMLASNSLKVKEFIKRLDDFVSKYGWPRKTQVVNVDIKSEKAKVVANKSQEEFMIALADDNTIRRIKLSNYSNRGKNNIIYTIKVPSRNKVVLISNFGMMYKLVINKISLGTMSSSGDNLSDLLNLASGEKIINIFTEDTDKEFIVFITKNAILKKMKPEFCLGLSKTKGAPVIKLDNDEVIKVDLVNDDEIITCGDVSIKVKDYKEKGRHAGGVKIKMKKNQRILL